MGLSLTGGGGAGQDRANAGLSLLQATAAAASGSSPEAATPKKAAVPRIVKKVLNAAKDEVRAAGSAMCSMCRKRNGAPGRPYKRSRKMCAPMRKTQIVCRGMVAVPCYAHM